MMKAAIANFLISVLEKLLPAEDLMGRIVASRAVKVVRKEVDAAIAEADKFYYDGLARLEAMNTEARQRHSARLKAVIAAPSVVTPEGAAALVAAHAASATVAPQG